MKVFESRKEENINISRVIADKFKEKKRFKNLTKKQSNKLFQKIFIDPKINRLLELKQVSKVPLRDKIINKKFQLKKKQKSKIRNLFKESKLKKIQEKLEKFESRIRKKEIEKKKESSKNKKPVLFEMNEGSADNKTLTEQFSEELIETLSRKKKEMMDNSVYNFIRESLAKEYQQLNKKKGKEKENFRLKLKYWQSSQRPKNVQIRKANYSTIQTMMFQKMNEVANNDFDKFSQKILELNKIN
jgi:hypothetical protein